MLYQSLIWTYSTLCITCLWWASCSIHPLLKSLGMPAGAKPGAGFWEPVGQGDPLEQRTIVQVGHHSASRVDSERKSGICVYVCMCVHVWGLVCVHMCVGMLTGAQCQSECTKQGSERETQLGSGSGVVMVLQRGACLLLFPVSFPFLAVRKWRCMEAATLSTRCFFLKVCKP